MERDTDGRFRWLEEPPSSGNTTYTEALPGYMTGYDRLFEAAKTRSEFDFVMALVHHEFDSNSDPFETTKRTFRSISNIHPVLEDYDAEVSLALWLYGHIVEASYPYQIIGDLASIAAGSNHRNPLFSPDSEGNEISPGRKIAELEKLAKAAGLKTSIKPFTDSWNADLRNAVFHSNYAIVGSDIQLLAVRQTLPASAAIARVNRAMAAFEAFVHVLDFHRSRYTAPIQIEAPVYWAHEAGTFATVVVREGYGPAAIYDTVKDIDVESPVIFGRLTMQEMDLVKRGVFLLPRKEQNPPNPSGGPPLP